ncbi:MAG: peptidoglycan DD-metalloendopeptidase family protein [Methylacidiphilales bacterium]|nr:peptidoglycan DD-metalloendopeptidase family protein [Candidatus Methylacidiphilales bacterium]NJR18077.1 peptidoglycan DD-metalloendopeptidase family protein [Calothrix sp. CSU_2_0]
MKRALKKKVKAAQKSNPNEDVPVDNLNEPNQKVNRRGRKSAAMIGLAISMGATSLFVTRQSDQALAAEPVANQNTASTVPVADNAVKFAATAKLDTKATSNMSVPENPVIVEPTAISQVPGLGAKLQFAASGASLQVPTTTESNTVAVKGQAAKGKQIASAIAKVQAATASEKLAVTVAPEQGQLKAQQELAISQLQEKSNRLRASLAELRSGETNASVSNQGKTTVGSTLTQPKATVPVKPSALKAYEVKPGDTLAAIAIRHGASVADIASYNSITNPNQLKISQKLNIPVAATPVSAAKTAIAANGIAPVAVPTAIATPAQPLIASENTEPGINSAVTTELADAPANANGMGGDTPAPKIFAEMQIASRNNRNKQAKEDRGLRSLQDEIERLRQRYRAQQSGKRGFQQNQNNTVAVPIPLSTPNSIAVPTVPAFPARERRNNIAIPVPTYRQNTVAVPIPVPTPMAPNYSNTQPMNPEWVSNVRNGGRMLNPPVPTTTNASESLGDRRGTIVTPQLPPLATIDKYIPRAVDGNSPPILAPTNNGNIGNVAYIWPAKGVLTSGYGWRWGRMHKGLDVANSVGTPIYASAPGIVAKAGWSKGGYGILVEIRHPDGSMTRYGHNSRVMVSEGQQVQQGDTIAAMGSTGFSTGPHTHFEIHPSGKGAVNPIAMLPPRV